MIVSGLAIPFDSERLMRLFGMIAKGLIAYHWSDVLPASYSVRPEMLTSEGERIFAELLSMRASNRVQKSVGGGLFTYEGAQGVDDVGLTIWKFEIYGGIQMMGDPAAPAEIAQRVWVTTSGPSVPDMSLARASLQRDGPGYFTVET